MRFNFDLYDSDIVQTRSFTPKEEVQWVPLQNHPVFTSTTADGGTTHASTDGSPKNLVAWDGASRLYYWDSNKRCIHRISIRLGEPEPTSVLAASPSKVLQADVQLNFEVHKISINRNGSALLLASSDHLCIMYLYGRSCSEENTIICRIVTVGSELYSNGSNAIRMLQVSWHPYSENHLGILSSDSVFRPDSFLLSSLNNFSFKSMVLAYPIDDLLLPEQEYYLQPVEPGRSRNATSICPVDFSYGGNHLWDRFSVFVLYADGSIYILCPVVPFGSVYTRESILEIHTDAHTFGLKSANATAVCNSNLAISWLEATFQELAHQEAEGGDLSMLRAHPYALFDASLSLQGPLRKVFHGGDEDLAVRGAECEGRAVSFLYNLVSKDSVLVTAWSGGQLQIDALADEIQPVWIIGSPPRVRVNSNAHILGLAMICESIEGKLLVAKLDQPVDHTVWLGLPPPLLRLAVVDLALPKKMNSGSHIMLFVDPLMPERFFSLHEGGIDSIVLHFLPFTSQTTGKDETMRTPSVHPVLSTFQGETSMQSPLCGFVSLSDPFGYSWIVGVTVSRECVVLEIKTWGLLLPPIHVDMEKKSIIPEEHKQRETPDIISKELLSGPKSILLPQASANLRSVAADSIEGRQTLHQYFKLFHENYVEYAHKVHFEIKHHGPHLKRIIEDQHARLVEAQQKLQAVERKHSRLEERIDRAIDMHNFLEQRLRKLRDLPGADKRPLSRAERDFKAEIDHFVGVEVDVLHSSIDALSARLRRLTKSQTENVSNLRREISGKKNLAHDAHISQLKSSLEKLSLVNSENSMKAKLIESALKSRDSSAL
ncbi:Nuclear pore complex protein Nup88 [Morella rubra]|uniref:Nuclear pore complex protein Nup88 n=1 Tax=Morella rubra TaxID=262757 RepID=A0A6A1VYH1_9ROSI|nr:Nuclear pore complex protein Nup88 [Morella rubra]